MIHTLQVIRITTEIFWIVTGVIGICFNVYSIFDTLKRDKVHRKKIAKLNAELDDINKRRLHMAKMFVKVHEN